MAEVAVALDVPAREPALALVEELGTGSAIFKVGLELFVSEGPEVVREIRDRGGRVFLDLKLHDIPNTVAGAVESAAREGVEYVTVHATGGPTMLDAAVRAAGDRVQLLAVTALTSLSAAELEAIWNRDLLSLRDEVVRLAGMATEVGVHGVVASAGEAVALRRLLGSRVVLATPGIRLRGDRTHDQARVATPAEAVRAGSDLLVVGRSVTEADDPRAALERIVEEAEEAADGGRPPRAPAGGTGGGA